MFEEFQQPEILRVPLEGLCLQVKLLHLSGGAEGFLGRALDPPSREALAAAMRSLRDIGALDHEDNLTALGQHLALVRCELPAMLCGRVGFATHKRQRRGWGGQAHA